MLYMQKGVSKIYSPNWILLCLINYILRYLNQYTLYKMLNILQFLEYFSSQYLTDFGTRYIVHLDIIKDEQLLQSYRKGPVVTTYIIQWSASPFNLFALLNISINQPEFT